MIKTTIRAILRCFGWALLTFFLVTQVLPVAAEHSVVPLSLQHPAANSTLVEQGIILYETGRFSEAAAVWQQAAQNYQAQSDRLNQALSLSYLSLAYQDLGQWSQAEEAISQSLELLANYQQTTLHNQLILARVLNTQGSLQLARGNNQEALNTWQQAAQTYANAGDEVGFLGSQINQAQALQALGLYRRAQTLLEQVNQQLQSQSDSLLKATALQSLGVTLQVVGNLEDSQKVLEQSLAITQKLDSSVDTSAILLSLANTARDVQNYDRALTLYNQAAAEAINPISKLQAQLNQLSLSRQTQQEKLTQTLLPQIQSQLDNLPPSRAAVYAQVNFAQSLIDSLELVGNQRLPISSSKVENSTLQPATNIAQLLSKAIEQARMLEDPRAESYALGQLGHLYEIKQQWLESQKLTQEALILARTTNADHIAYRWQWQLGRILKQQGDFTSAIAAYTQAVNTLKSLRSDLVAVNPDVQFSFRESVEPVYRELVGLLLQSSPISLKEGTVSEKVSQQNLKQAREVIESLQLAELDNFFRQACLDAQPKQIDEIDSAAAVIYPIILPDRLSVILSLPGQELRYYETNLPQTKVENVLEQLLQSLNPAFSDKKRLQFSQQVYQWLIQPAEVDLAETGVKTLVFVLDSSLRNLPMSALYDGQKYLVEKYSIALSQGLQLLEPRALKRERPRVLTAGITEASQGFSALPGVELEIKQIASQLPTEVLLDQQFTSTTLQKEINAEHFSIVHLATHAQFSSQPEETFLLTWNGRVKVKELAQLLQTTETQNSRPIELLVLSACQTATGDRRATLGLAGVAVQSGARSTVATLWSVRDNSTAYLMAQFYQELSKPEMTKAEALRQAQLSLLKESQYQHPLYWAPFVLVGNWL